MNFEKSLVTLIPGYKVAFIKATLDSIAKQSVIPSLVIISDDTPGQKLTQYVNSFKEQYVFGIYLLEGPKIGPVQNIKSLLNNSYVKNFDYIHLLFDDDVIYPNFYFEHLNTFKILPDILCSISRRYEIDEAGIPFRYPIYPPDIMNSSFKVLTLNDKFLFESVVLGVDNYLGEFSNSLFRRDVASYFDDEFLSNYSYKGLEDVGFFLKVSMNRPLGFINQFLSGFRHSSISNTSNKLSKIRIKSYLAWISLLLASFRMGYLSEGIVLRQIHSVISKFSNDYQDTSQFQIFEDVVNLSSSYDIEYLDQEFTNFWNTF